MEVLLLQLLFGVVKGQVKWINHGEKSINQVYIYARASVYHNDYSVPNSLDN